MGFAVRKEKGLDISREKWYHIFMPHILHSISTIFNPKKAKSPLYGLSLIFTLRTDSSSILPHPVIYKQRHHHRRSQQRPH